MILTALGDVAVDGRDALMVGDTTYDMDMVCSGRRRCHRRRVGLPRLRVGSTGAGAHAIADDFPHLMAIIAAHLTGRSANP